MTNIKKSLTGSSLTALLLSSLLPAPSVWAANDAGTITVSGKVVANTCTLDKADTPLTLDVVSTRDIVKGKDTAEKDLTVSLKDCGAEATKVGISTTGEEDSDVTDAFKNTSTGDAASGVGLHFYSISGGKSTVMKPDGSVQDVVQPLTKSADSTLNFKAAYTGTKEKATAGDFKSVVKFTLNYE